MYKLLNFLFGYDYITWENSADRGIARVHVDKNGIVFYWRYIGLADTITNASDHLWLTCKPSKYLKG